MRRDGTGAIIVPLSFPLLLLFVVVLAPVSYHKCEPGLMVLLISKLKQSNHEC